MSNVYDTARYRLMTAQFNWVTTDLVLIAWSGVVAFFAADVTVAQMKAHGGITERGRSLLILNKAVATNGMATSGPAVIPNLAVGAPITFFTICINNAVPDNAVPILHIDEAYGLPLTPNGTDCVIQPDWAGQQGWWRA